MTLFRTVFFKVFKEEFEISREEKSLGEELEKNLRQIQSEDLCFRDHYFLGMKIEKFET